MNYSTDKSNDRLWGLTLTAWVQIGLVALVMGALFRFNLVRLWGKTNPIDGQDVNWQHSLFVPLIGLYYLYIHRDELLAAAVAPRKRERGIRILASIGLGLVALLGLALGQAGEIGTPIMLLGVIAVGLVLAVAMPTAGVLGGVTLVQGLLIFSYGIWPGQNDYVKDLGMVVTLFGVVTLLCGWAVMRVAWFPIAFLVVALPWPELVYSKLAWPLQKLAASAAVGTLRLFGVTAQNFGTKIMMFGQGGKPRVLNVAEACAGLKSVMTFLMVAGTVAFLGSRPLWEKLVMTAMAIPIAIFCNVLRVAGQGLLDFYWSHEVSEGFAHQFVGLIMLIPGFFLIMLVGWVLEKLFIEEVDRRKLTAAPVGVIKKRVIVEVPRKASAAAAPGAAAVDASTPVKPAPPPATVERFPTESDVMAIATPGVPAVDAPAAPPRTPRPIAAPPAIAPKAAPAPAAKAPASKAAPAAPAVKPAGVPTAPPSTLKAPATARPAAAPGATGSTLKPSSKPTAARTVTPPPAGLKPASAAKPGAPGAKPVAPPVPPQGLKPAAARPRPAAPAPQQQSSRSTGNDGGPKDGGSK